MERGRSPLQGLPHWFSLLLQAVVAAAVLVRWRRRLARNQAPAAAAVRVLILCFIRLRDSARRGRSLLVWVAPAAWRCLLRVLETQAVAGVIRLSAVPSLPMGAAEGEEVAQVPLIQGEEAAAPRPPMGAMESVLPPVRELKADFLAATAVLGLAVPI